MRQAAGIMLMILGALMLVGCVVVLIDYDINVQDPVIDILFVFFGAYLVSAGFFALRKSTSNYAWVRLSSPFSLRLSRG